MLRRLTEQRWFGWAREIAVVLAVLAAVRLWQQRGMAEGTAPALNARTTTGEPLSLDAYRGAPTLLVFWATWCGTCRMEQGNVEALSKDYPVVTVASQSGDAAAIAGYLEANELTFATVPDPGGAIAKRFAVRAYPSIFILDADGTVDTIEVGFTSELGLRARMWLAGL